MLYFHLFGEVMKSVKYSVQHEMGFAFEYAHVCCIVLKNPMTSSAPSGGSLTMYNTGGTEQ